MKQTLDKLLNTRYNLIPIIGNCVPGVQHDVHVRRTERFPVESKGTASGCAGEKRRREG